MHCSLGGFFSFKHGYGYSVDRQTLPMDLGPLQNILHTGAQGEQYLYHTVRFSKVHFYLWNSVFCSSTTFHKAAK